MSRNDCDIAIVGGGLVGASLACALAPMGYRVTVVEAVSRQAEAQPSYDDRTLALNLASCRILQGLGLWPGLAARATPIREVIVSELDRPGEVRLRPQELGLEAFGHVVEARDFGHAVDARLAALPGVQLLCPARVTGWAPRGDAVRLEVKGQGTPECLGARLVVAADGARSALREMAGIAAQEKDYGQTAVICNVTPEQDHAGRAWERMTPTGPFALLPHREGRCGLVWCVDHEQAQGLLGMDEAAFLLAAAARLGGGMGPFRRLGRRSAYPLRLLLADHVGFERGLLLGSAAHAVHPAGAQGFNLGLRDVAVLAEVLASPAARADPGAPGLLAAYRAWRRPDREATVAWTDGMVSLFSSPLALSATARTLGLLAHALLPPLRRRLATRAMGYRGRSPRLALGEPLLPPGGGSGT